MGGRLSMATRKELIDAIGKRYRAGTRRQRRDILNEFVQLTGYHRKHAIRVLATPATAAQARARERLYDEAVRQTLIILWEAADRICGKRLKALLPTLIEAMESHGHLRLDPVVQAKLLAISAATIDRVLLPTRVLANAGRRPRSGIGSAIRQRVPVRTFADWNDPPPGYFEIDLVEHCGGVKEGGNYVHSLVLTDIATGWTECVALPVREQTLVVVGLRSVQEHLPFAMRGIDTDNDSVFMNETVRDHCEEQRLEWTRSRAYKKNDQAWVEQKNGAVVRRLVGYGRLSGLAAAGALARLYASARLYINFFQPSFKLKSKQRDGALVRKRYHAPLTPHQRLLASPAFDESAKDTLRAQFATLDPVDLLKSIRSAQHELATIIDLGADSQAPANGDVAAFLKSLSTAWQTGEVRPTHRRKRTTPRSWRTRVDPFAQSWPLVEGWLAEQPHSTAKDLMKRLTIELPDLYPTAAQLRTLQRRVQSWRAEKAKALVLGAISRSSEHDDRESEVSETTIRLG
jgi:hypothetical protein